MTERYFLRTDSKEIGQSPARMCSPNCLTGPPISTYSAPLPAPPLHLQDPQSSVTAEDERRDSFFSLLIGRDDGLCFCLFRFQ